MSSPLARGRGAARHALWAHVRRIQAWLTRGRLDLVAGELEELAACAEDGA